MMNATQIRTLRERLGLAQAVFAKRLGVTIVTLSRWENGQHAPQRKHIKKLERMQRASDADGKG